MEVSNCCDAPLVQNKDQQAAEVCSECLEHCGTLQVEGTVMMNVMIDWKCPNCGVMNECNQSDSGSVLECWHCMKNYKVVEC